MRLRLEVVRHGLPPVKVMWPAEVHHTVSHLLEAIDAVIPLEAEGWGFEDYSITIAGYELLHWQKLGVLCKENDEISIKPLQTDDIRERRVSGRLQITADGRHLVDGYPYGRPALRAPVRPDIRIPSRKRIRLTEDDPTLFDGNDDQLDGHDGPLSDDMTVSLINSLADTSEEDAGKMLTDLNSLAKRVNESEGKRGGQARKRVSFEAQDDNEDDDDDDDDDDFDPTMHRDESDDEDEYWDDAEDLVRAIEAGNESDSSWEGIDAGAASPTTSAGNSTRRKLLTGPNADPDADSDSEMASIDDSSDDTSGTEPSSSDDSSSDSSSSSSDDDSDAPSVEPITPRDTKPRSAPYEGKAETRKRNQRRREGKKLKYLQEQGVLPKTANKADMLAWQAANGGTHDSKDNDDDSQSSMVDNTSQGGQISEAEDLSLPELNIQQEKKASRKTKDKAAYAEELNKQREALLTRIANGGIDVQESLNDTRSNDIDMTAVVDNGESTSASPEPARRKLDIAASQRMLFGSLGVRRPQNDGERQKLRKKLAAQGQRKAIKQQTSETAVEQATVAEMQEEPVDPELWKKKINLSAVECVTEDVEYIKPPFPFHQRWDPQMRDKKRKGTAQNYKSTKRARKADEYDVIRENNGFSESYDAAAGDALDYGDEGEDGDSSSSSDEDYGKEGDNYWDEVEYLDDNAGSTDAASAQLLNETTGNAALAGGEKSSSTEQGDDADLPPLPADLAGLPALTEDNAKAGAIITFSRFEVSAATNWAPGMSPVRVGRVSALHEDGILEVKLAKRDVPQKQYDTQGRRMLSGFETDLGEEEDDGVVEVALAEIVDGRLMQEAPAESGAPSVDVEAGVEGDTAE